MTDSAVSMMLMLAAASVLPFILAAGTCYLKFSIVFVMVRNALGVQQVPSNMVLNAIAFILAMVVMFPLVSKTYAYVNENPVELSQPESLSRFTDEGLQDYRTISSVMPINLCCIFLRKQTLMRMLNRN